MMTGNKVWVTAAFFLYAIMPGCRTSAQSGPQPKMSRDPLISLAVPKKVVLRAKVVFFGRVESKKAVQVRALTDARVMKVVKRAGARVRAGDLLFVLGGMQAGIRLRGLRAGLDANRRVLTALRKQIKYMKNALKRGLVTFRALSQAHVALAQALAKQAVLSSDYKAIRAAIKVRAPVSGIFSRRVVAGRYVRKGEVLASVTDPDDVRVKAWVFPKHNVGPQALANAKAVIQMDSGRVIHAKVTAVLLPTNRAGSPGVWIEPVGPHAGLIPGLPVQGQVILQKEAPSLVIPGSAIVFNNLQQAFVFVKTKKGYEKRRVNTGEWSDQGVRVTKGVHVISGIRPGDQVVVKGACELFYKPPEPED